VNLDCWRWARNSARRACNCVREEPISSTDHSYGSLNGLPLRSMS
jgi:hypothetical protein